MGFHHPISPPSSSPPRRHLALFYGSTVPGRFPPSPSRNYASDLGQGTVHMYIRCAHTYLEDAMYMHLDPDRSLIKYWYMNILNPWRLSQMGTKI